MRYVDEGGMDIDKLLVYLACIYEGNYRKMIKAIQNHESYDKQVIERKLGQLHSSYTTILNDDYPKLLRTLKDPPLVLFYHGQLSLCDQPCLAMVGMREADDYGRKMAAYFSRALSSDFVIVSGLAKGIDGVCHRNAKKTIAVLGCGINYCYPKCHQALYEEIKKDGLVISEYPEKTLPKRYFFPFRNRIVAGLSLAVIVIQARVKSGSMITVGHALEQGKAVFALPCRISDHNGTLALLKDGAILLSSILDVYEELNFNHFNKND